MVSSDNTQKTPFRRQAMSGIRIAFAALALVLGGFDRTQAEQSGPFAGVVVDSSLERYSPKSQVAGGFRVQGSDTMHALMRRISGRWRPWVGEPESH